MSSYQLNSEPPCQTRCFSGAAYNTQCYTEPSPTGHCSDGYFRPYNLSYINGDSIASDIKYMNALEWTCKLCAIEIANCCNCTYSSQSTSFNSTATPTLKCLACSADYELIDDVTCGVISASGSLSKQMIALIAVLTVVAVIFVIGFIVILRRKGCLGKSNSSSPPQLPTSEEWANEKAATLKAKLESEYDPEKTAGTRRYTAEPATGLSGRRRPNRVESVNYGELELSAQKSSNDKSKTSAAKNGKVQRNQTSVVTQPNYEQDEELYVNTSVEARNSAAETLGLEPDEIYQNMSGPMENTECPYVQGDVYSGAGLQGNGSSSANGRSKSIGNSNELYYDASKFQSVIPDQTTKVSSKVGTVSKVKKTPGNQKVTKPSAPPKADTSNTDKKKNPPATKSKPKPTASVVATYSPVNATEDDEIYENNPAALSSQKAEENVLPEEEYSNMEELKYQQQQRDLQEQQGSNNEAEDENIYANQ